MNEEKFQVTSLASLPGQYGSGSYGQHQHRDKYPAKKRVHSYSKSISTTLSRNHPWKHLITHNWSDPKTSVCIALLSFTTALWYFLMKLASGRFSSNSTSANKSGITNSGRCCEKTFESGCVTILGGGARKKIFWSWWLEKGFFPKGKLSLSYQIADPPTHREGFGTFRKNNCFFSSPNFCWKVWCSKLPKMQYKHINTKLHLKFRTLDPNQPTV